MYLSLISLAIGMPAGAQSHFVRFEQWFNGNYNRAYAQIPLAVRSAYSGKEQSRNPGYLSCMANWVPFFVTKQFVKKELTAPYQALDAMNKEQQKLDQAVRGLGRELRAAHQSLKNYDRDFDLVKQQHAYKLEQVGLELGNQNARQDVLDKRVTAAREHLCDVSQSIAGSNERVASANAQLRSFEQHIESELGTMRKEQRLTLASLPAMFNQVHARIDAMGSDVQNNRTLIAELDRHIKRALATAAKRNKEQAELMLQLTMLKPRLNGASLIAMNTNG